METVKGSKACFVFLNKRFVSVSSPRVMSTGKGLEERLKGMSSGAILSHHAPFRRPEFTALHTDLSLSLTPSSLCIFILNFLDGGFC